MNRVLKKFANNFMFNFWYCSVTPVRFITGTAGLLWSVMLFWPGNTFDRPTYTIMADVALETVWATMFLVHGALMVYNAIIPIRLSAWLAVTIGIVGCFLWSLSSIAMLLSVSPPPAAIAPQIAMSISSWWLLVRYDGSPRLGQ